MRILIAEDERITRSKLKRQLERMGHSVVDAADGREAWELFQKEPFSLVISDWDMPEMSGVDLVRRIRGAKNPGYVYIVLLTGKSAKEDVVEGIEAGADDFISKPFDRDELRARLNAGLRIIELEHQLGSANKRLRLELAIAKDLADAEHNKHVEMMIGESIPVRAVREGIARSAANDEPLLLKGPPGAGQESVARTIHRSSERAGRAFIYVACAHIPEGNESVCGFQPKESQDAERFGKAGLANGGTLYLENVELLSHEAQSDLVDFLQRNKSEREAGRTPDPDVRVIAYQSEHRDPDAPRKELSENLRGLLAAQQLAIPSLAERREDILPIAQSIIERSILSSGKLFEGLSDESKEMLLRYSWPGNVRELQSVVERAAMLSSGTRVEIPPELLREGRRVGGYTLQQKIGAGGMGEVWLAKHSLLARPSAIKLIRHAKLVDEPDSQGGLEERFQREAEATAQLRSPHTVELYDFGVTDEGDFFYVMEYLKGVDLHTLVDEFGPLTPSRAIYLLRQACVSLGEAHLAGMVHRDIKPENLFICQLGTHYDFLKLLDFGIVRSTRDADGDTATGMIKGSPYCISPEAARGRAVTFASDVYGLGCVAYWLLTGRQVFEAPGVMALLLRHVSDQPDPPKKHRPDLPAELDALVLKCLAKDPAERPRDAIELGKLLKAVSLAPAWDNDQAESWWDEHLPTKEEAESTNDTVHHQTSETSSVLEASHPDGETLARWEQGKLTSKRAAEVEAHLEQCDHCAERLGEAGAGNDQDVGLVGRMRNILHSESDNRMSETQPMIDPIRPRDEEN